MVRVRVNGTHLRSWQAIAHTDGRNLSEWIRWLADRRIAELAQAKTPRDTR
jgi:hypothetical protein